MLFLKILVYFVLQHTELVDFTYLYIIYYYVISAAQLHENSLSLSLSYIFSIQSIVQQGFFVLFLPVRQETHNAWYSSILQMEKIPQGKKITKLNHSTKCKKKKYGLGGKVPKEANLKSVATSEYLKYHFIIKGKKSYRLIFLKKVYPCQNWFSAFHA